MKHLLIFCSIVLLFTFYTDSYAQSDASDMVVGTVGNEKITYKDLKENLLNGLSGGYVSREELEDFLPTYLLYRAKLLEAAELGIFESPELLAEYENFAKQSAYVFWLESHIKPKAFEEFYKRSLHELKSYHVLLSIPENVTGNDTLRYYDRMIEARNKYLAGTPMPELDSEYSTKQNGRSMGGDLPWFGVGATVKEFEDVLFSLKPGDISMPVRTQFGYHIVLLQDKRERIPSRQVSHIFRRPNPNNPEQDAEKVLTDVYNLLETGSNWNDMVRQYTQDDISIPKNGQIGWIGNSSRYSQDFLETVMNLDTSLKYTKPLKSSYGFHIFRVDSIETYANEAERRQKLMKEFENTPYYVRKNSTVINRLRSSKGEQTEPKVLEEYHLFLMKADTIPMKRVVLPEALKAKIIYSFNAETFSVGDLHAFHQKKRANANAATYRPFWMEEFTEAVIDERLVDITAKEFPEFKNQINRFKEGLGVFRLNDMRMWSGETVDSTALEKYFKQNIDTYTLPERPYFHMISSQEDSILMAGIEYIKSGQPVDSIRLRFPAIAVLSDSLNVLTQEPFDSANTLEIDSFSPIFKYKNRNAVLYLVDRLPERKMSFEEAFSRVLSDYQPIREERWNESLKKRYKIKPNKKNLAKAHQKESS